jgi:hypothetical protein
MRPALAASVAVVAALALAPGVARAEPPRVAARLDYSRGPGGEACPADTTTLRALVAAKLGYDPFERSDAHERVVVVVSAGKDHGWSARVERYNAAGVLTFGPETFPDPPLHGDCEALISPLAAYLRGMLLEGGPPPAARAPAPPPPVPQKPPEPPEVPNPARIAATRVAIASYVLAGAFLGLGVGWTVDARNKRDTAQSLSAVLHQSNGELACTKMGGGSAQGCAQLVSAAQRADAAEAYRNASYVGAGVCAAVGITSTVLAFVLPRTIKGHSVPQVAIGPTGLLIHGSF